MFTIVVDPVGGGFVDSLARPGGNITGFMLYEYSLSGKWLELLKQIAPGYASGGPSGSAQSAGTAQFGHPGGGAVARGGGQPDQYARAAEIERGIAAFARSRMAA